MNKSGVLVDTKPMSDGVLIPGLKTLSVRHGDRIPPYLDYRKQSDQEFPHSM
jgi:hypothetical protein